MKRLLAIAAAAAAVFISGCAHDNVLAKAQADATAAQANARVAEAQAAAEQAKAVQALASKIDAGGASAYLVATALKGLGVGQGAPQIVQAPPQRHWAIELLGSAFGVVKDIAAIAAPVASNIYAARVNAQTQQVVAGYNRDVQVATVNAFSGTATSGFNALTNQAGLGFAANTAIASHIPQPPGTTYNVTGSQGVNFGAGNVTYNPITSSYNPTTTTTNPNPIVVTCTGTPTTCTK